MLFEDVKVETTETSVSSVTAGGRQVTNGAEDFLMFFPKYSMILRIFAGVPRSKGGSSFFSGVSPSPPESMYETETFCVSKFEHAV